jgi:D-alanyl-D-alanine carboxypeptidase
MAPFALALGLVAAACSTPTYSTPHSSPSASSAPTAGTGGESGAPPAFAAELEPLIAQKLKDNAIPGAVVLIDKGGQGRWLQTFGTARVGADAPLRPTDYFRVGSNTKTMTATIILQLVQERRLALDDPVAHYYPGVPNGDSITIGDLLDMRSGLPNYTYDPAFVQQPQKAWTPQDLLALSFAKPVDFAPGAEFEYSNTNYIVLGLILEKITGMSAPEAFRQRIFEPLGLTHTSLPGLSDNTIPGPHPSGYMFLTDDATLDTIHLTPDQQAAAFGGTLKPDDVTDWNPSPGWTAGSAISTADDMAVYTKKLVTGGLLDEKTQQLRLDSINPVDPTKPNGSGYGLGLARIAPNLIGHDGQIPGYTTLAVYDPHIDLLVVILTNLYETPAQKLPIAPLLAPIVDLFYGRSGGAPKTSDAAPTDTKES